MRCIICKSPMIYYFSKFIDYDDLGVVEYYRCKDCGFVASATHFDMDQEEWERLNYRFHTDPLMMKNNPDIHQPPYSEQAMMLSLMRKYGLLKGDPWLDWGAGGGDVSRVLADRYGIVMLNFDKYINPPINALTKTDIKHDGYNFVLSSAVFEHVRNRDTLDEIDACVNRKHGMLGVHTLVRGEIPKDPTWMYLLPVHCSFHTNRSMQMLMDQWGYLCSVYNELAKLWVMFREPEDMIFTRVKQLNSVIGYEYLHYKKGFMDFWP
jgi:hypothetical protein